MADETVWFSKKNITIYHIYEDCRTLDSVGSKDLDHETIDLKPNRTTNEPAMRLCRVCKREWEETADIHDRYFT